MRWQVGLCCVLALQVAAPAHAAWYKASSKHFIIYADENPKVLSDFASHLERFDAAARILLGMDDPPVGDGNRLTIYVLPTDADVRKLAGDKSGFLSGFYTGRVEGSLAYIPKRDHGELGADTVLYHEYTHHLMMQQLDQPYPEWYVEGFAEFLSSPIFEHDGSVGLGTLREGRMWSLTHGRQLPLEQILGGTYGDISKLPNDLRESVYDRGWLLVHYLRMEPKRQGQLDQYILGISRGEPALQSAEAAFGDLKQLDADLNSYMNRTTLKYFKVAGSAIHPAAVDLQPLSAGASEIVLLRGQMKYGDPSDQAEAVAAQARSIEARYAGDPLVEATLAEAELKAGHAKAAEMAADRAIKAEPGNAEPLILKASALEVEARDGDGDGRKSLFDQARQMFIAANKLDTEDPEPLYDFYWSFLRQGIKPNDNAIAALHYASDLAPQDIGVRMNSAIAYLEAGKLKDARSTLMVVAYAPHAGEAAVIGRRMMADIDAGDAKAALADVRPGSTPQSGSH